MRMRDLVTCTMEKSKWLMPTHVNKVRKLASIENLDRVKNDCPQVIGVRMKVLFMLGDYTSFRGRGYSLYNLKSQYV